MKHPWQIWSVYACCTLTVAVAVGWISVQAWRLDRAEAVARRQATVEEHARLALWRIDSAMAPLIAQESARPDWAYHSFIAVRAAGEQAGEHGPSLLPSLLMVEPPEEVLLHFQLGADGTLTSPRVPPARQRPRALDGLIAPADVERSETLLARLGQMIQADALLAALPPPETLEAHGVGAQWLAAGDPPWGASELVAQRPSARGVNEFQVRSRAVAQNSAVLLNNRLQQNQFAATEDQQANWLLSPELLLADPLDASTAWASAMTPLWVDGHLLLARRVRSNGQSIVQGCWLDWPGIQTQLLAMIEDLLPEAELQPLAEPADPRLQSRLLASLPAVLDPGPLPDLAVDRASPVGLWLLLAWGSLLLAAAAVAAVLQAVVSLSERRAAFVSAVTHELRTPLTTFRMYAEMLAEGMVADGERRQQYLATLRDEADRLAHLVENVLAYARLERNGRRAPLGPVTVERLLGEATGRLAERVRAAGRELVVERVAGVAAQRVVADGSAVEQILLNLVDNACKYARPADDPRLHLEVEVRGRRVEFRLRDHGPGVSARERRRLFQPFHKSAGDAAHSAPGVGLGLALSRRLARDMGGDLRCDARTGDGACFTLVLKRPREG